MAVTVVSNMMAELSWTWLTTLFEIATVKATGPSSSMNLFPGPEEEKKADADRYRNYIA